MLFLWSISVMGLFRAISTCFDKKIAGPVDHPLEVRACKIGQSHCIDSSRKLTKSSLRQQGAFLTSPVENACQSVEKSCFVFWNDNCRPASVVMGHFCSLPAQETPRFSHIAIHRCHESSPHRTRVTTKLGERMLH